MAMAAPVVAITLDLDDTLWPVWPTIERAEQRLHDWLAVHAPATAAAHDTVSLRRVRNALSIERPELAHDLTAIRRESIRRVLGECGEDPALADAAFEVFFASRQEVTLFDDALPALQRLAARYPVLGLTNGNADLQRVGIAAHFRGCIGAREFGAGKPEPGIFHEACRRLGAAPAQVLHVGDDPLVDVVGALRAGLQAAWVRRDDAAPASTTGLEVQPQYIVTDLAELADRLGA